MNSENHLSNTAAQSSPTAETVSNEDLLDLSHCILCPRSCGADRTAGKTGSCGEAALPRASRAALLYYEEPCISGSRGSGAVFFNGCSLGCVFCQNYDISLGMRARQKGFPVTAEDLSRIFLQLQEKGANNINLVTAGHFLPALIPALREAKENGLRIPIVYNSSGYERAQALRLLDGLVDIYLPDCKYMDADIAARYSHAPDYPETALAAIDEMVRQCPEPVFADGSHSLDEENDADDPLMTSGVIVRHLVLPGHTEDSKKVIRALHERYGERIFISIMNQYTPMPQCAGDPLLSRKVTKKEYDEVVDFAISIGVENGFIQEGDTVSKSFIPAFDGTGILDAPGKE